MARRSRFDPASSIDDTEHFFIHSFADIIDRMLVFRFLDKELRENPLMKQLAEEENSTVVRVTMMDVDLPLLENSWGYGIANGPTLKDREPAARAMFDALVSLVRFSQATPLERAQLNNFEDIARIDNAHNMVLGAGGEGNMGWFDQLMGRIHKLFKDNFPEALPIIDIFFESIQKILDQEKNILREENDAAKQRSWVAAGPFVQKFPDGSSDIFSFVKDEASNEFNMIVGTVSREGEVKIGLYENGETDPFVEVYHGKLDVPQHDSKFDVIQREIDKAEGVAKKESSLKSPVGNEPKSIYPDFL